MAVARFFRSGVGMSRDHRLVPVFDVASRMFQAVLFNPPQDRLIVFQTMHRLFESIAIELKKTKQMLVEADGFIIVTVEEALAMQLGLVDQTGEMNVAAELFVRTARMQSSHGRKLRCGQRLGAGQRYLWLCLFFRCFRFG